MGIKRTLLAGLMALCLGVSSLAAADGTYVKQDTTGKTMGDLLVILTDFGGIVEVSTYRDKEDLRAHMDVFRGAGMFVAEGIWLTRGTNSVGPQERPVKDVFYLREFSGEDIRLSFPDQGGSRTEPDIAGLYVVQKYKALATPDMGRILLEQIGPELTLFDLNKKGVLCNYSGELVSANRGYAMVPMQKSCHKYEVFDKNSKIVMTYLVAKDLSEAYRVKPNGEALQIYAHGGLG
ncbi:MAG: hypothetical protein ACI3XC_02995 [Phascolarctobacterium sp.]